MAGNCKVLLPRVPRWYLTQMQYFIILYAAVRSLVGVVDEKRSKITISWERGNNIPEEE